MKYAIIIIRLSIICIIHFCVSATTIAQIKTTITQGSKSVYSVGDKIEMTIVINTPIETCADGLGQVKLFQSGIEIQKQSNWKEIKKGTWQKEISLTITGNKKDYAMLTVMRRADKQSFSYQQRFDYIK